MGPTPIGPLIVSLDALRADIATNPEKIGKATPPPDN
jgi:hypothetical protein